MHDDALGEAESVFLLVKGYDGLDVVAEFEDSFLHGLVVGGVGERVVEDEGVAHVPGSVVVGGGWLVSSYGAF